MSRSEEKRRATHLKRSVYLIEQLSGSVCDRGGPDAVPLDLVHLRGEATIVIEKMIFLIAHN